MSIIHGKNYNKIKEGMTNKRIDEINNELTDLSSRKSKIISDVNDFIDMHTNKINSYNGRIELSDDIINQNNIYTGNVFKDLSGNYFLINEKGVIKYIVEP